MIDIEEQGNRIDVLIWFMYSGFLLEAFGVCLLYTLRYVIVSKIKNSQQSGVSTTDQSRQFIVPSACNACSSAFLR
jgi:uncharacterized membrane protein